MTTLHRLFLKPWLYVLIILVGIFLKFYKIQSKLFWDDEISTIQHTSGIKQSAYTTSIPTNEIKHKSYYDSILHLSTQPYTIQSEISGIFHDTHLTPLHYVFLTVWYRVVGDKDVDYRLFSVFIFIISLPFLFALAKTLFKSNLAGWIAASLYAISPFINLFSQESRYYILWAFFFILCNYLFLRAINSNKNWRWITYSIAAILSLYTSILSGLFILGHFIYVILLKKERLFTFSISLFVIVLSYLPWFYFLYSVRDRISSGLAWHVIKGRLVSLFEPLYFQLVGLIKSFFFCFEYWMYGRLLRKGLTPDLYLPIFYDLLVFVFICYAFYYLFKKTSKEIRSLLILNILPLFLFLYVSDLVRNSFTSAMLRYQIISMVCIGIVVTNLLYSNISKGRLAYGFAFVGLVIVGVVSILKIADNRCWMTRGDCPQNIMDAQILSSTINPLVITDFDSRQSTFMSVLNDSKSNNIDVLYTGKNLPDVKAVPGTNTYSEAFVMHASDSLVEHLKKQFGSNMLPYPDTNMKETPKVWRIRF